MVSLIQIQTFLEVARAESFIQASKQLSVPRSTVSARIQALEESLNIALLTRTTRQVALTHEGQRYYDRCSEAIDTLKTLEEEFQDKQDLNGLIRISVPIDYPKENLADILCDFNKRHSEIFFDVIVTDDLVDMVAENVDLSLRGKDPGNDGLIARKLGAGEMVFVASPTLLDLNSNYSFPDLLSQCVIFDPTGLAEKNNLLKVNSFIHTKNFELAKGLAIKGKGIAFIPQTVCESALTSGELTVLKTEKDLPKLSLFVVRPAKKHLPQRVRAFVDFLAESENIT